MAFKFIPYMEKCAELLKEIQHSPTNKKFFRASSINDLEELLSNLTQVEGTIIVVIDNVDGRYDFRDSRNVVDAQFFNYYVLKRVPKINDFDGRQAAREYCRTVSKKIEGKMFSDWERWNNSLNYVDFNSLTYYGVGPLATQFFGQSVSFIVNENPGIKYNPNDWVNNADFTL